MIQRSLARAHLTAAVFSLLAIYLLPTTIVAQVTQPSLANMPGSILIYPFYTSHSTNRQLQDTRFVLTNTGLGHVSVRLFFISGISGEIHSYSFTLQSLQSLAFLASDVDPDIQGYLLITALDWTGAPTKANVLTGSETISDQNGVRANIPAFAVQKLSEGAAALSADGRMAELRFDGAAYTALPGQLVVDSIPSQVNGFNVTRMVLLTLPEDITASNLLQSAATATLFSNSGDSQLLRVRIGAQRYATLSDLARGIENLLIPQNRTGWMSITETRGRPIFGVVFNVGEVGSGRLMTASSVVPDYSTSVPVFPPATGPGPTLEIIPARWGAIPYRMTSPRPPINRSSPGRDARP
jgi:hypothetical protein